ncbi:MAG: PLP-dependent transferase [Gemmatimonadaceae bacterium]|jgi:cystathionine gamma-synthase|nr:PLP-dependent transferase [Gemmatimonadaceae bacterium]
MSFDPSRARLETRAVHAGRAPDPTTGAVIPPIVLSTTFVREPDYGTGAGWVYARDRTPNRTELEGALAALEAPPGTDPADYTALAFASGMAATTAVLHCAWPGARVLLPERIYYHTRALAETVFGPWGLVPVLVPMDDLDAVRRALDDGAPPAFVWLETPSNPTLTITDIAGIVALVRAHTPQDGERRTRVCVDNTWASPLGQQPLALGADVVMHSTTKYLAGHSDVTGGALVLAARDPLAERLRKVQVLTGSGAPPFDAWLVARGIASLPARWRMHVENARAVAEAMVGHPAVHAVHYPFLPGHPNGDVARRQMRSGGAMLSLQVRGGRDAALAVTARVRLFTRATSLGGVESLIEHRASVEGPTSPTPHDLLRCSIGLEHAADLIADLEQALDGVGAG